MLKHDSMSMKKEMLAGFSLIRVVIAAIAVMNADKPVIAAGLIVLAGITDLIDGFIARKMGIASPTGGVIDGIADKAMMLIAGIYFFAARGIHWGWLLVFFSREIYELIGIAIMILVKSKKMHIATKALVMGKATTVLQYIALISLIFEVMGVFYAVNAAIAVTSILAVLQYWREYTK